MSKLPALLPTPPTAPPAHLNGSAAGIAIRLLAPALLAAAIAIVYANALHGGMILDDSFAISHNPSIQNLRHFAQVLMPPHNGTPVQGRPMVNLSFAINYALGGDRVVGYHLFNVGVHILNALLLFGVVRRTLALPRFAPHIARRSVPLAFAIALLWGVHPLATAAVDYISQRTELLVTFFYLLTLYCVIRSGSGAPRAWPWQIAAVAACALGMTSKEVMVSAPVVILIYDRLFLSDSWNEIFRRRGLLYAGLAATWTLLGALILRNGTRHHTVGFGGPISPWHYALTQCRALALYLKLSFWPSPLIFDYGSDVVTHPAHVWPQILLLLALGIGVAIAFRRHAWLGFLGFAWFAILAPTSSIVPIHTQVIGEHRAYLPLAAVVAGIVIAVYHAGHGAVSRLNLSISKLRWVGRGIALAGILLAATALGAATMLRHQDYRTDLAVWNDVIRKCPTNARAFNNRSVIYNDRGDYPQAIQGYTQAIKLDPAYADAYDNRGNSRSAMGDFEQAIADYDRAIQLVPSNANAYNGRGQAHEALGEYPQALADFSEAIRLEPGTAQAYYNRGNAFCRIHRYADAIADYDQAIHLRPSDALAYNNRGNAYHAIRRYEQAIDDFSKAIGLDPAYAEAYNNRGNSSISAGRYDQALADASRAIALKPDLAFAHNIAGNACYCMRRYPEAITYYTRAIQLKPDYAEALANRSVAWFELGNCDKAWADVAECRRRGGAPNPKIIKQLTQASGRSE